MKKQEKFSIRKFKTGVGSVLVATTLIGGPLVSIAPVVTNAVYAVIPYQEFKNREDNPFDEDSHKLEIELYRNLVSSLERFAEQDMAKFEKGNYQTVEIPFKAAEELVEKVKSEGRNFLYYDEFHQYIIDFNDHVEYVSYLQDQWREKHWDSDEPANEPYPISVVEQFTKKGVEEIKYIRSDELTPTENEVKTVFNRLDVKNDETKDFGYTNFLSGKFEYSKEDNSISYNYTPIFGSKPVTTEEKEIPFETITNENPDLEEGVSNVIQKGVNGTEVTKTTYNTYFQKGDANASEPIDTYDRYKTDIETTTEVTKEPVNEIIEVGTKKKEEPKPEIKVEETKQEETQAENQPQTDTVEKEIKPVETESKEETVKESVKEVVPYKIVYEDTDKLEKGVEEIKRKGANGEKVDGKITKEPVDQLVLRGTKVVIEKVPYDVVYQNDPELPVGKELVVQEGVNGEKEKNGEVISEPVPKIISRGTKITTEPIPFETEYKDNPEMAKGQEFVIQEGKNGVRDLNGKVITKPINRIIERGTKEASDYTNVNKGDNFTPTQNNNSNTSSNTQANSNTTPANNTPTTNTNNTSGNNTSNTTGSNNSSTTPSRNNTTNTTSNSTTSTTAANNNTSKTPDVVTAIPFDTIYEEDPEIQAGQQYIKQHGQEGTSVNGKVTKSPVNQIIVKGTKATIDVNIIPFNTIYEDDSSLPVGVELVKQGGVDGIKENDTVIKQPVDKIVARGTKKVSSLDGEVKGSSEIPYDTIYEKDETLEKGKEEIKQEGRNGLMENGVITREPVNKIIKVGTKQTFKEVPADAKKPTNSTTANNSKAQPETGVSTSITALGIVSAITSGLGLTKFRKKNK